MIYFDQAATSFQKPDCVTDAVIKAFEECASAGRSGHVPAMRAGEILFEARCAAAEMFDACPEQVVFTFNATHGLNLAIRTLVSAGSRVIISGFEHNAVVRPLSDIGAEVITAGTCLFDPDGTVDAFENAINHGADVVICTHISNVFGYILPIERIAEVCCRNGIPFIIDASQSAGVLPISMKKLQAAFIAMPGHKGLYGPQGTGILLCGQLPKPLICGGTGSNSEYRQMPDFLPDIGEAGTHNIHGIAGLKAGIRYVSGLGTKKIMSHEQGLLQYLADHIRHISHIHPFLGPLSCQSGVISFVPLMMDCERLAQMLGERQIAVRSGMQCAPLAHQTAGTIKSGTVRISFSVFNRKEEVDALLTALTECLPSRISS